MTTKPSAIKTDLPTRTLTGLSSAASTSANPSADTGSVGALLVERLRAWKHAVSYLEAYVSQTESLHKTLAKEYQKVLKTVDEPLREGHHFHQSSVVVGGGAGGAGAGAVGGVASFFDSLRANTVRLATSHQETAAELRSVVLTALERLHKSIRDRQKHVAAECERSSKAVGRARANTQQQVELLAQHTAAADFSSGGAGTAKPRPDMDPYVLKRVVLQKLGKQVLEENAQHEELLGVQSHTQVFEQQVLQALQAAVQSFSAVVTKQLDTQRLLAADTAEKCVAVPQDFEWINFVSRSAESLADAGTPKRTVEAVRFPNEDHVATKPLVEGALQRKGTFVRSYNNGYYVLTKNKFLHEFKDQDHLNTSPSPELSLYLPDCTVSALSAADDGKFQISGKDSGSMLSSRHEFAFKAGNRTEGRKWHDAISSASAPAPPAAPVELAGGGEKAGSGQVTGVVGSNPPAYTHHDTSA